MRSRFHVTLLGLSVFAATAGCESLTSSDILHAEFAAEQEEIARTIREIYASAERKELDRLEAYHFFGPKFSKFGDRGGRQDAEVTRAAERNAIGGLDAFRATVDDLKVDVFGETAVATFIVRYEAVVEDETVRGELRTTMVFVRVGHDWKIAHEHFSPYEAAQS